MEILAKFGVEGKILLAQVVNFLVLLYVLRRFAYQPLLRYMEERSQKIAAGLRQAEDAVKTLKAAETEHARILSEAREEAARTIRKAEATAKAEREAFLKRAEEEVMRLTEKGERDIQEAKARMLDDARAEVAELVLKASEKLLGEKLDAETDRKRIQNLVKHA